MLKVTLISHTPNPEKTVAAAAKLCYASSGIDDIFDDLTQEKTTEFVEMLVKLGHQSPVEHASFTFGIEGVSRALLAQITRHRIASFSVQSQRYVREAQFEYVLPPQIADIPEAKEDFIKAMQEDQQHYENLTTILKKKHFEHLLSKGIDANKAERDSEKMAIEDARFVLPNACSTKMIVTMNTRSLYNFFEHRCCNRAQWEIRELAIQMLILVLGVAPSLFRYCGPACSRGACSEGKMTCGKIIEVREAFTNMKMGFIE